MASSCEYGDEPLGSGTTKLLSDINCVNGSGVIIQKQRNSLKTPMLDVTMILSH
jgi:hypothetical protein